MCLLLSGAGFEHAQRALVNPLASTDERPAVGPVEVIEQALEPAQIGNCPSIRVCLLGRWSRDTRVTVRIASHLGLDWIPRGHRRDLRVVTDFDIDKEVASLKLSTPACAQPCSALAKQWRFIT